MKTGMISNENLLLVNYNLKKLKSHSVVNHLHIQFLFDIGKKSFAGYTNGCWYTGVLKEFHYQKLNAL